MKESDPNWFVALVVMLALTASASAAIQRTEPSTPIPRRFGPKRKSESGTRNSTGSINYTLSVTGSAPGEAVLLDSKDGGLLTSPPNQENRYFFRPDQLVA